MRTPDPGPFQTEEQLKAAAKRRREEQARLDALKPPPPPRKQKAENFWYHYKWHTIAAAALVLLGVFFLRDTVFRPKPDLTVILVTGELPDSETMAALESALCTLIGDRNGDGKQLVTIDQIQYIPEPRGEEAAELQDPGSEASGYMSAVKLTTVLAANTDPFFLIDRAVYEFYAFMEHEDGTTYSLFQPLDQIPAADGDHLPLARTRLADMPGCEELEGLYFCVRESSGGSQAESNYHRYCLDFLRDIAQPS